MNAKRNPSGWHLWPLCITAFFALAIAGCIAFVVFCSLNPSDLVAEDYYEQELRHQTQMQRVERARTLGPEVRVHYDSRSRRLEIRLPGAHAGANGDIHLYRPSALELDRRMRLQLDRQGRQSVAAESLRPGLWRVRIDWVFESQEYSFEERVLVGPPAGKERAEAT